MYVIHGENNVFVAFLSGYFLFPALIISLLLTYFYVVGFVFLKEIRFTMKSDVVSKTVTVTTKCSYLCKEKVKANCFSCTSVI